MGETENNKQTLQHFIQSVWREGNLAALPEFWTADCVNHAMSGADNCGLEALQAYHEQFIQAFSGISDFRIEIVQQVAEADRVVSQIVAHGRHSGAFMGIAPSDRSVSMQAIRIDRFAGGKIAEHWSVADLAGLMQQIQS